MFVLPDSDRGFTYPYQATLIGHEKDTHEFFGDNSFCMVLKTPHREKFLVMPSHVFENEDDALKVFKVIANKNNLEQAANDVLNNRDKAFIQANKLLKILEG